MGLVAMGRRRRFWSDEEKRTICAQARAPGVSVARVARRHGLNANLIFTWLRDPRFAPEAGEDAVFLPVEVSASASVGAPPAGGIGGRVEIVVAGGHRVVAGGGFDPEVLGRLLRAWLS